MRHDDECSPEPRLVPKPEEEEAVSNVLRMLRGATVSISWKEAERMVRVLCLVVLLPFVCAGLGDLVCSNRI